jgi:hypothetical protein
MPYDASSIRIGYVVWNPYFSHVGTVVGIAAYTPGVISPGGYWRIDYDNGEQWCAPGWYLEVLEY